MNNLSNRHQHRSPSYSSFSLSCYGRYDSRTIIVCQTRAALIVGAAIRSIAVRPVFVCVYVCVCVCKWPIHICAVWLMHMRNMTHNIRP